MIGAQVGMHLCAFICTSMWLGMVVCLCVYACTYACFVFSVFQEGNWSFKGGDLDGVLGISSRQILSYLHTAGITSLGRFWLTVIQASVIFVVDVRAFLHSLSLSTSCPSTHPSIHLSFLTT